MIRAAALALLLATPAAAAGIGADLAGALDACLADGPALDARAGMLDHAGWYPLRGSEDINLALDLATLEFIRNFAPRIEDSMQSRFDKFTQATEIMLSAIDHPDPATLYRVADTGAALRLSRQPDGTIACVIATKAEVPDLAARLGSEPVTIAHDVYTETRLAAGPAPDAFVTQIRITPGYFGAGTPRPLLLTPSARVGE